MTTRVIFSGSKRTIELLCNEDGSCDVGEFLEALEPKDRRKVDVLFELLGNKGQISNSEKFKKLEGSDGVLEFKSFQIRLLCFFAPQGRVVICRGVIKKKDRHAPQDVKHVEQCRKKFLGEM